MNNLSSNQNINNNNDLGGTIFSQFPSLSNINNINNSLNINNNILHNFAPNPNLFKNNIINPQIPIEPLNKSVYDYNRMFYLNNLNNLYYINNINPVIIIHLKKIYILNFL